MTDVLSRLDDIEDGSDLRRGHPAAHNIFGVPQTINAASYAIVEALRKAHELSSTIPSSAEIAFGEFPIARYRYRGMTGHSLTDLWHIRAITRPSYWAKLRPPLDSPCVVP